jgi:hypothetical protein
MKKKKHFVTRGNDHKIKLSVASECDPVDRVCLRWNFKYICMCHESIHRGKRLQGHVARRYL